MLRCKRKSHLWIYNTRCFALLLHIASRRTFLGSHFGAIFHYGYEHFYTFWYFCKFFLFSYIVNLYFKISKKSWWLFSNALRKNTLIYMLLLTAEYLMNLTSIKRLIKCFIFLCWIENIYHLKLWENFFNLCMRVCVFIRMCLWALLWYTLLVLMFYIFYFVMAISNLMYWNTVIAKKFYCSRF